MPEITLPKGFTEAEKTIALDYLETTGSGQDWPKIIRRLWVSKTRSRTLVVFLKSLMWDEIDGDTLLVAWRELENNPSQPVRITHGDGELVVADYELWKDKMRSYQARQEEANE